MRTQDKNEERRAVKQVFAVYHENLQLLAAKPVVEEAQLALEWTESGGWLALDDLTVQKAEAERYNKKIKECVAHYLTAQESRIIKQSYMSEVHLLPWQIYEPMHIEQTAFFAIKARAIGKLYVVLRLQRLLRNTAN